MRLKEDSYGDGKNLAKESDRCEQPHQEASASDGGVRSTGSLD